MDRTTFFEIYEDTIKPLAKTIIDENSSISIVHTENPAGLYECYLLKVETLKSFIKSRDDEADKESAILDRHKISACFAIAIIETRLLSDERVGESDKSGIDFVQNASRFNEQLAFMCGVAVLSMYMATRSEKNEHCFEDVNGKLNEGFVFPPSVCGKTCPDSLIRALYYSHLSYGLNPILLASIFYLLEQYFYKHHGITLNPNKTAE